MVYKLLTYGNTLLRSKSSDVTEVSEDIVEVIQRMVTTMYAHKGIGLSAVQIGELLNVIIVDPSTDKETASPLVLINPRIVKSSDQIVESRERCLSLPTIECKVKRHQTIYVSYMNLKGERIIAEKFSGHIAFIIQHEIDHLHGVLITDHVLGVRRKLLEGTLKKISRRIKNNRLEFVIKEDENVGGE